MPTSTFTTISTDDGSAYRDGASYPPAGGFTLNADGELWVSSSFPSGTYFLDNAFVRFDTSSLPDGATITAARLKLYCTSKTDGGESRTVGAEFYDYGGDPVVSGDWASALSGSSVVTPIGITSISTAAVNTFTFVDLTGISKTGYTGLRMLLSGGAPGAGKSNDVRFDGASTVNADPTLEVDYVESGYWLVAA